MHNHDAINQRTHVVIGVIYNATKDKILISKRSENQHLAAYWEFPGGKVEANEDVFSALRRELCEELGIIVHHAESYTSTCYDYPDKKVLLDIWIILEWSGEPASLGNQEIRWVNVDDLNNYKFPEANQYIIQSILLQPLYVISKTSYDDYSYLFSGVKACFSKGLKIFQLRLNLDNDKKYQFIVDTLSELAGEYNAKFILNGVAGDIEKYTIGGIHLNSNELKKYNKRPISEEYILGASCHNQAELKKAADLNVNYAFMSPVLFTNSHPEAKVLGWEKFSELINGINMPIYALGGMTYGHLDTAKTYGAYGIAMVGAIWESDKPGSIKNLTDIQ